MHKNNSASKRKIPETLRMPINEPLMCEASFLQEEKAGQQSAD